MINWISCAANVISLLLFSFNSFLSFLQSSSFKVILYLLIISQGVELLTIDRQSGMMQNGKRVGRSVMIVVQNHDLLSTFCIKPIIKEAHNRFLTESNNQIQLLETNPVKNGHFIIETIPNKLITKHKDLSLYYTAIVFIKKYNSDTCICMNINGSIYTQESFKLSRVEECGWYLEETAYGIRFINILNSLNSHNLSYLAICNILHQNVCRYVGEQWNMHLNTFWTFGKITPTKLEQIPYPLQRHRFNYQSLLLSIEEKSIILCDEIKYNVSKVAYSDVEQSINTFKEIKTGMTYLRLFLVSHFYSKRNIKYIFQGLKELIRFYGFKMRKKMFRNYKFNHEPCLGSLDYMKYCTTFRSTNRFLKTKRLSISRTNRKLIKLLMPLTNLNYLEKSKWLKKSDFLDFVRNVLLISFPAKSQIMKASYFLLQYLNTDDPFSFDTQQYKDSKYFEFFVSRKIEELSFGTVITMRNSSVQILENVSKKLTLLDDKNVCYNQIVQILHKHSKCSTRIYLNPCLTFRVFKT